jgi:hypothetical protein
MPIIVRNKQHAHHVQKIMKAIAVHHLQTVLHFASRMKSNVKQEEKIRRVAHYLLRVLYKNVIFMVSCAAFIAQVLVILGKSYVLVGGMILDVYFHQHVNHWQQNCGEKTKEVGAQVFVL